jgi:hypothetical protein
MPKDKQQLPPLFTRKKPRKIVHISREEIEAKMKEYFMAGGKITKLDKDERK